VNDSIYVSRRVPDAPKYRHTFRWLQEWAKLSDLPIHFPSVHHPLKSLVPMRFCCVLEENQENLLRLATAAFSAYYVDQKNLDDVDVMIQIANKCGLPGQNIARLAQSDDIKMRLRSNTNEAIQRGAFGSPTIFVDHEHQYFGNDQLPLVEARLASGVVVYPHL
jgi:2-hydroxychromene-2-carboxylate isomerase